MLSIGETLLFICSKYTRLPFTPSEWDPCCAPSLQALSLRGAAWPRAARLCSAAQGAKVREPFSGELTALHKARQEVIHSTAEHLPTSFSIHPFSLTQTEWGSDGGDQTHPQPPPHHKPGTKMIQGRRWCKTNNNSSVFLGFFCICREKNGFATYWPPSSGSPLSGDSALLYWPTEKGTVSQHPHPVQPFTPFTPFTTSLRNSGLNMTPWPPHTHTHQDDNLSSFFFFAFVSQRIILPHSLP